MAAKSICVAAIQMVSENRAVESNLARARELVAQAAAAGAQLVLLPEMFAAGFELNAHAWKTATPQNGRVEQWLCKTAQHFNLHLGGSYLESRAGDFYNTFALASPQGAIAGRVGKRNPCGMEAYLFKASPGPVVIDTELGRIGVTICYDSCLRAVADDLLADQADLVLMPMSAPSLAKSFFFTKSRIESYHAAYRTGACEFAKLLGIPAVMVNKWGPWETTLPSFWPSQKSSFPGFSHIADRDGRELCRQAEGEGTIVAHVQLDPQTRINAIPPARDCWRPFIGPMPAEFRLFAPIEALGRLWYARHHSRYTPLSA